MSKIIAVIGATGVQGGSVVATLLKDGKYKVRAITRNIEGPKAKALQSQGAEPVFADLNDEASLAKAFEGVSAIYAVTDFFEPFSTQGPEKAIEVEYAQGVNLARAASQTKTLEHYIWSTLANGSKISGGKWVVPHFEAKNRIDDFIKADKALFAKTTFLWNSFYASNLFFPMFTPNLLKSSGKYVWLQSSSEDTKVVAIGDPKSNTGPFVSAILAQPKLTLPGRFVLATTETLSHGDILRIWGEVTGQKTQYVKISTEDFDNLWPMWGKEMGTMMEMWEDLADRSWSGEDIIGKEELGIKSSELVGVRQAFENEDWTSILA